MGLIAYVVGVDRADAALLANNHARLAKDSDSEAFAETGFDGFRSSLAQTRPLLLRSRNATGAIVRAGYQHRKGDSASMSRNQRVDARGFDIFCVSTNSQNRWTSPRALNRPCLVTRNDIGKSGSLPSMAVRIALSSSSLKRERGCFLKCFCDCAGCLLSISGSCEQSFRLRLICSIWL